MATNYEDLEGGLGRSINYRAERFLVRKFLEHQVLRLVLPNRQYVLHDISMNGVSFFAPTGEWEWEVNAEFEMSIRVQDLQPIEVPAPEGKQVFKGSARVARVKLTSKGQMVGLQLLNGFLNLPKIQWDYEERLLKRDIELGYKLIHDRIPEDYRTLVESTVFFLQFYKQSLTQHEKRYAARGDAGQEALQAMTEQSYEHLQPVWEQICGEASKITAPYMADLPKRMLVKKYTETMLTTLLLDAPSFRSAYLKPLGYAGDFQVMDYFYRNTFEGSSVFNRVFHKIGCEDAMVRGIRARKELIKKWHTEEYRRFCDASEEGDVFRVTNLGSGPAREVSEFVEAQERWDRSVTWTLIDQDEEALGLAYNDVYPRILTHKVPAELHCKYVSFIQLMRDPRKAQLDEPQQLIYLAGLLDYLKEAKAKALVSILYNSLAPGGVLAIGNARWPNDYFWGTEFIVDWTLIYRTRAQMLELAEGVDDTAEREIVTESAGSFHFLVLRKP